MGYNLKLLKNFSLRSRVLCEVAKICWGDFVLNFPYEGVNNDLVKAEMDKLLIHRIGVCDRMSEIVSTLPKTLGIDLTIAVLYLQSGYMEAFVCAGMYNYVNSLVPLNPLSAGPYAAKNFIDPSGYFNELLWAKLFVSDENVSVFSRFELACYYCFEKELNDFWNSFKEIGNHPYEIHFQTLRWKFSFLVALWVYRLDNKIDELVQEDINFRGGFYNMGFRYALDTGNEYSARFFWDGMPDRCKARWFSGIDEMVSELLTNMAFMFCAGCANFVLSLLSVDQKRFYLLNSRFYPNFNYVLNFCLLYSPFYQSTLNDLLTFSIPDQPNTFRFLLEQLAFRIKLLPIPRYKQIFRDLWKSFSHSERIEFLETESNIIQDLSAIGATDLLKMIIQPLPPSIKERMLLLDWQQAGISALDRFSEASDYNEMCQYLFVFLININPVTQKRSLKDDALQLIDTFYNGGGFVKWINGSIPNYEKEKILSVKDNIQGSLQVINSLLLRVETWIFFESGRTERRNTKTPSDHQRK